MYFTDAMFNPQYANPYYYAQQQAQIHQASQNKEVQKAAKALRDLCQAVKKMDGQHQQQAFWACLEVMADEFGWSARQ